MSATETAHLTPSAQRVAQSNLSRFMAGHRDYESLWRWSVEQPDEFWPAVWRFCGVKSSQRWDAGWSRARGCGR